MAPRPVLVIGATGGVGQHVVRKLLERGEKVHALARTESLARAKELFGDEPVYVAGDVRQPGGMADAVEGAAAVICCLGSRDSQGDNNPEAVDYGGIRNLVAAATAAMDAGRAIMTRFVLISSLAVTHPEHPLNQYGRVLDWKLKGEDTLRQSRLPYAIVRPGRLTDEPGGQQGILFDQGDRITGKIARADVAEVCIQALDIPFANRVTFEVVNAPGHPPEDFNSMYRMLKPDPV